MKSMTKTIIATSVVAPVLFVGGYSAYARDASSANDAGIDRQLSEDSVDAYYEEIFTSTDQHAREAREDVQKSKYVECLKNADIWREGTPEFSAEEERKASQCSDSVYAQDEAVDKATSEYQIKLANMMLSEEKADSAVNQALQSYSECMKNEGVPEASINSQGVLNDQVRTKWSPQHSRCSEDLVSTRQVADSRAIQQFEDENLEDVREKIRHALAQ